jgi:hypothetical protein
MYQETVENVAEFEQKVVLFFCMVYLPMESAVNS